MSETSPLGMPPGQARRRPNVVFVFADQWRYQALGYTGNHQVRTPYLDRLANESVNLYHAISGSPVCSPARASLLTGQYPDTHGVFLNDAPLEPSGPTLAEVFREAGYHTGYIGKWHVNNHGRSNRIPPERRRGFEFWRTLECTHDYRDSKYFADDEIEPRLWDDYDAFSQTREAQHYLRQRAADQQPFLLCMSWGPPHAPYHTAPEGYQALYRPQDLQLRPNVPHDEQEPKVRQMIAGYYAHCTALDDCIGELLSTLEDTGLAEDTIFVFWSDHGDMLGSQGQFKKQRPWDESIRVPLLIRHPRQFGKLGRKFDTPINTPDLMPTLLGLAGLSVPDSVQGIDYAAHLRGEADAPAEAALLACYHPFGQFTRDIGGREYRGVRTRRYTYCRDLNGPWLLYDNEADPHQLQNLVDAPDYAVLRQELEEQLQALLDRYGDTFSHGDVYVERWGYTVNEKGTIAF